MTAALLLVVAAALVVACGLFVAAEFSLVTVDRSEVSDAASSGDAGARRVERSLRQLSTQLSGAQVGITLTNLAIGFLAEPAVAALVEEPLRAVGLPASAVPGVAVAVGLVVATAATMVFGELVPKNIAIARPLATARATARFQQVFTAVMHYPIAVLNGSANAVVRRLGVEPQEELRSARSADELASLVARSAAEGTLDSRTASLLERAVAFGDRITADVMTPRVQMTTVDASATLTDLVELARSTGRSRFPVTDPTVGDSGADDVLGAVHVKHVTRVPAAERGTTPVSAIMVTAPEVPTSLPLDPLAERLRTEGFQLAFVIDEYGGTAGLVTLEDVIEELVGDIADEHDRLHDHARGRVRAHPDGSWTVSGLLRPDEVAQLTGVDLPSSDDYDTVAGLFLQVLGRMPQAGDRVAVPLAPAYVEDDDREPTERHAELAVEHLDGLRIDRLRLVLHVGATPVDGGAP